MSIGTKHPLYINYSKLYWTPCRDLYAGEEIVKQKGVVYLPPTPGQAIDGMKLGEPGEVAYQNYKMRAQVPDYFADAVETFVGLMHEKPPIVTLPDRMKYLIERCSAQGESLHALLRRINEEQLVTGRVGLLCDLPNAVSQDPRFYVAFYPAESIINWDSSSDNNDLDRLDLVVLDESTLIRDANYSWSTEERYRELALGSESYYQQKYVGELPDGEQIVPQVNGRPNNEIPFVFVNSADILPNPSKPPLMGLVRLCYSIYRSEADYRFTLFQQGQDTLVVIGGTSGGKDAEVRVGAGARIDVDQNGDAKYIGVSSDGLSEQRTALENDRARANQLSGKLVSPNKSSQESGEALKTRIAAQTATLNRIAETGAFALQTSLRFIAKWLGIDENQVSVKPNLEFAALNLMGDDLVKIMVAKKEGAPISLESVHALLRERGLTIKEYNDELNLIKSEPKLAVVEPANPASTKKAGVDSQAT